MEKIEMILAFFAARPANTWLIRRGWKGKM
jgi:hypothetical protein